MLLVVALACATVVVGADQGSKTLVVHRLNRRHALAQAGRARLAAEWAVLAAGLALALGVAPWAHAGLAGPGIGLLLGGLTGNAHDLWHHRGIRDIVDIGGWPVFNVADAAFVTGLLCVDAALLPW